MALFRRRAKSQDPPPEDLDEGVEVADDAADDPGSPARGSMDGAQAAIDRSTGPFDEAEADRADQALPRLDLGSLLIPGLPGIGVQVEADNATQEVRAVTGVVEDAAVQLQVFAAPRSEGLWDELRAEMVAEIGSTDGARVSEEDGPFGPEVRAVLPARAPDGKQVLQTVRFVGIDGPRWLLRAAFLGRAAVHPDPDDDLHRLVRQTIVVRGPDAMAPRDPLPLRLPEKPAEGMEARAEGGSVPQDADAEADATGEAEGRFADLDPFERGPEITEVR